MFGKTLPEILQDAGMNDEEIEMFRERFNQDTNNSARFSSHIFRIEEADPSLESEVVVFDTLDDEETPKLAKLKESMKKSFTPPEDQYQ
tara:strand:+ start:196 stop:462 length:267 start_codon:yes stop_codon:yes gene_type:complete